MGSAGALARNNGGARAPFYGVVVGGRPAVGGWSVCKASFYRIDVDIFDSSLQVMLISNIAVIVFWHPENTITAQEFVGNMRRR